MIYETRNEEGAKLGGGQNAGHQVRVESPGEISSFSRRVEIVPFTTEMAHAKSMTNPG
jgi:hypothetical protein